MLSSSTARRGRIISFALVASLLAVLVLAFPASAGRPKCFGRIATKVGTSGADEIAGTRRSDVIVARGGDDLIRARGGRDFVCAGAGEFDVVWGGRGSDRVRGGRGFDAIFPGAGDDLADGEFVTYEGSRAAVNVDLNMRIATGQGRDRLVGVDGAAGSEGDDVLIGTDTENDLHGFGGSDTITAGDGDDFINTGAGDDTIDGGPGLDFADFAFAHAGPRLDDDTTTDVGAVINLVTGAASGGEGVGDDTLSGIEGVGATLGDDTVVGNDAFNDIVGFEGDDSIDLGTPGTPDFLGTQDVAFPGAGDDTVTGSNGTDAVDYSFNSLMNEPMTPVTIDLQAGTATGTDLGSDTLRSIDSAAGTFFADTITGTPQSNLLIGLDGSDTINGGPGDDTLDGDAHVFGLDMELEGEDVLDGGPGTDVCVGGGQSDTGCESFELPPAAARKLAGLRVGALLAGSYQRYFAAR